MSQKWINFWIGFWEVPTCKLLCTLFKWKKKLGLIKKATDDYIEDRDLTFSEDFNEPLDEQIWNYTQPTWNQYMPAQKTLFTKDSCIIKDSILTFMVKKEHGHHEGWDGNGDYEYKTGAIHTNYANEYGIKGFSQKFGRFELKAKPSNIRGTWGAFWLLSHRLDIPTKTEILPEIDIIENFGGEAKNQKNLDLQFTVHYGSEYNSPDKRSDFSFVKNVNFSDEFYIFALEWDEKKIKWYINDNLVKVSSFKKMSVLDRPLYNMFIVINDCARPEFMSEMKEGESFEGMKVDWVRVYQ